MENLKMDGFTRSTIIEAIRSLQMSGINDHTINIVSNWLYGAFDGYDYSAIILPSIELAEIKRMEPDLGHRITMIFKVLIGCTHEEKEDPNTRTSTTYEIKSGSAGIGKGSTYSFPTLEDAITSAREFKADPRSHNPKMNQQNADYWKSQEFKIVQRTVVVQEVATV